LLVRAAAEDEWDSDREERLEREHEADEDSGNDGDKENAPQQASRGRDERSSSRKVAAVEEDEDEAAEEAAAVAGSSGSGGQVALRRPPVLFQPDDLTMMTEAQKKDAGLHVERIIHVYGGKGRHEDKYPDGKATVTMKPGAQRQWALVLMRALDSCMRTPAACLL
jgi:hypothetical protein